MKMNSARFDSIDLKRTYTVCVFPWVISETRYIIGALEKATYIWPISKALGETIIQYGSVSD